MWGVCLFNNFSGSLWLQLNDGSSSCWLLSAEVHYRHSGKYQNPTTFNIEVSDILFVTLLSSTKFFSSFFVICEVWSSQSTSIPVINLHLADHSPAGLCVLYLLPFILLSTPSLLVALLISRIRKDQPVCYPVYQSSHPTTDHQLWIRLWLSDLLDCAVDRLV